MLIITSRPIFYWLILLFFSLEKLEQIPKIKMDQNWFVTIFYELLKSWKLFKLRIYLLILFDLFSFDVKSHFGHDPRYSFSLYLMTQPCLLAREKRASYPGIVLFCSLLRRAEER